MASAGSGVTSVVFGPSVHDSVDADDGVIDGSGLRGDSFFSPSGAAGVRFNFNAAVLGSLPTHAGLVWTDGAGQVTFQAFGPDGAGQVTFQAFGPGGNLLGTIGPTSQPGVSPDNSVNGETAEDRFFGVTDAGGISALFISNSAGGIEVDHLQFGLAAPPQVVPEPSTLALLGLGAAALLGYSYRRKRACAVGLRA
ncbi:MAG: PEP-CTERM sorting domain-containing protein [candidate division KSB1 bacterium]|nr:PEP-CTERM sorting domain-containing protein [candidate division KSB1 bacterium]